MKKLFLTILLILTLLTPSFGYASTEIELRSQLITLLQQMIQVLTIKLNELQRELAMKNVQNQIGSSPPDISVISPIISEPTIKPYGEIKRLLTNEYQVIGESGLILFQGAMEDTNKWFAENAQPFPYTPPKQCHYEGKNTICN